MENEVEAAVGEARKISHISLDALQLEAVTIGDEPIPGQLLIGEVETGHVRARRGEYRSLLPASRAKAEHRLSMDLPKPVVRHRKPGSEDDLPRAGPCLFNRFRIDGSRPNPAGDGLSVPSEAIVIQKVHDSRPQEATGGMTATRPCLAKTTFSFSRSGGPPAFTMAA